MASNKVKKTLALISIPIVAGLCANYFRSTLNTRGYQEFKEVTGYSREMTYHYFEPKGGFVVIKFCEGLDGCNNNSASLVNVPIQIYRKDSVYTVLTNINGTVTITDTEMIGFSYPYSFEINGDYFECTFVPDFESSEYEIIINTSYFACPSNMSGT